MSADAGLAQIQASFNSRFAGAEAGVQAGPDDLPDDPMARLIMAITGNTRTLRDGEQRLIRKSQAVYPIPIPAMAYTVTGGALSFGAGFGGSQHMGPRDGEFWGILRAVVDGLVVNGGQPAEAFNDVTDPGALATIASIGTLTAGTYLVNWTVGLEGTVTAADANNMRLLAQGNVLAVAQYPGAVGEYPQPEVEITILPASQTAQLPFKIQSVAAASGASAIYTGEISVVPVPEDQVVLYKRYGSAGQERLHTFTAAAPEWAPGRGGCVLRPGDALQLAAPASISLADDSQILLSGDADRVAAEWIGDYLL